MPLATGASRSLPEPDERAAVSVVLDVLLLAHVPVLVLLFVVRLLVVPVVVDTPVGFFVVAIYSFFFAMILLAGASRMPCVTP